jgi:hypothetical protein
MSPTVLHESRRMRGTAVAETAGVNETFTANPDGSRYARRGSGTKKGKVLARAEINRAG